MSLSQLLRTNFYLFGYYLFNYYLFNYYTFSYWTTNGTVVVCLAMPGAAAEAFTVMV